MNRITPSKQHVLNNRALSKENLKLVYMRSGVVIVVAWLFCRLELTKF